MIFNLTSAVQLRYLLFLGLVLVGVGSQPGLGMIKPPSTVFGEYVGIGCPDQGKIGTCLPTTAMDRVRIVRGRGAEATVTVRIIFDQGHTCTLEGRATWSDGHFTVRADGPDPNKPCQLVLRISGSILTLEDPGGSCREVYCGTRGVFDGARFKKKSSSSRR